ncbi:FAD-dependent oxidoreductase [Echinicola strongylocentroti]|uniref:FAD-dependent oxidoreductase n=1 Tax=Echinicola strongylocentroti TaxID=1795355 RepID=A0A2Z4IPV9_9BACT|nr:FAD-dependent oxidoreductase [Echinicola strongylocentroti]AWW32749.1 FAD-dependent oxidoreductase [Echinicola strongylocentroti]
MKDNKRRNFLKTLGMSSGAFLFSPEGSFISGEQWQQKAAEADSLSIYKKATLEVDLVVIGGGMSGICAAISGARNGAKVALVHDRSRLGGNASSEIRMHVSGSSMLETFWRETGILEEIMLDDAVSNPQTAYPLWDFVLYNKVVGEPNITLLLDTLLFEADADGKEIKRIKTFSSQTEEIFTIHGKQFADCTGDGTLAALVGADYMRGREAKSTFGESLGQEVGDKVGMGNSLLFMADEFDKPMPYTPPSWARKYTYKDFEYRYIHSLEYGYWWLELAGEYDIINDGRELRHELLAVLFGVWDYIKNSGNYPEASNWALTWVGMVPGKRESRRILGDYVMTQNDVQNSKAFPDRVAYGGWPLDDHPAEGMDDTSIKPNRAVHIKEPYNIPLRVLYSKNIKNLWMAGRNISVSHVALSSTRVMATCATLGQAIGTAMAISVKKNITAKDFIKNNDLLGQLQQTLLRQDQAMLQMTNLDRKDMAKKASISASSELNDGLAKNIIDGVNRKINNDASHQWQGNMEGISPWISLTWNSPVRVSTLEFTFDTGLHRYLRISGQKVVMEGQVRGPQPETISDYKVEGYLAGIKVFSEIHGNNYYRKVSHELPGNSVDSIKITVLKTHGDDIARIFEIRCYA